MPKITGLVTPITLIGVDVGDIAMVRNFIIEHYNSEYNPETTFEEDALREKGLYMYTPWDVIACSIVGIKVKPNHINDSTGQEMVKLHNKLRNMLPECYHDKITTYQFNIFEQ